MSTIINTYSYSFLYDLKDFFSLDETYIKNLFSINLPDILNKTDELKENLNNCKELKTFLAKKRNLKIEEEDINQNKKHFKKSVSVDNVKDLIIDSGTNENIYIEKDLSKLYIYKNPIILMELYDCQTINIDLINDNFSLEDKMEKFKKFKYKIYSLDKTNYLNISDHLELPDLYDKSISFENENIYPYLLVKNNPTQEIKDSDLLLENIYKVNKGKNRLISPSDISSIYFYYFNISSELQKKYNYIESENRKNLNFILSQFLNFSSKNITIITGPKGIGKTSTLIKFSFQKEFRIFYFNLETFQISSEDNKKKELKLQLIKLFRNIVQEKNDQEKNSEEKNEEGKNDEKKKIEEKNNENKYKDIKKNIENYIDMNIHKSGLEIIYNIIKIFKNFAKNAKGINFGFIIDQYSPNYHKDIDENSLNMIINLINESNNIKLILCPTINNIFSKEQINTLFYTCLQTDHNYFKIYYFQEFISKDEFFKYILVDEKDEYKNIFDELGYLPKHYYDLKNLELDIYKDYLTKNLNNNIKEYYLSNNKNIDEAKNMNNEILYLLELVKGEKLISSSEFEKNIKKFPLKYLKITKYKINDKIIKELSDKFSEYYKINDIKTEKEEEEILIKYLKLLWNNEENNKYDKIISKNFFIEERNINELINENYFEKDKRSMNIYGNYYKTFIDTYNNYFDPNTHGYEYIYVYKLNFSFNFIENIFLEYLCEHIKQENLFFSKVLDRGACGGIYELLLGYYIQKNGSFLGINIEQTIYVSSLVPNNYSIKYYSYSKTKKSFKEFILNIKKKKRNIDFKNTFIKQTIFNSKYYDMAILVKSEKENTYKLLVIQATIMKDEEKRMTKDEHELILRSVKLNLENEFDIIIEEASFIYILSKSNGKIEDQETQKDCDKNKIEYIGFDINDLENNNKYIINLDKAFITKLFPIHNAASLLAFSKVKKSDEIKYLELKAIIDENKSAIKELKDYHFYIKSLFKNKYEDMEISQDDFYYFEITYSIFDKNKNILNYLSAFSFLIFIENNDNNIYIHFDKTTYKCNENFNKIVFKPKKKDIIRILFCYSTIPLAINNKKK